MRIDVHAHFLPRDCFDAVDSTGRHFGPSIVTNKKGEEEVVHAGFNSGPVAKQMYDVETRIKDMDATGVDMQAISAVPSFLYYAAEPEACLWYSRRQNDGFAEAVKAYPKRFVGMATVPLQDSKMALAELDRAVNKLGLRGVKMLSNINGKQLDDPSLMPFYKEVETLGLPIFIHPWGPAGKEKMGKYYLINFVGFPTDSTLAAAHLIFGGVLEKFPGLKFYFAHAGGTLPYLRGRFDHGYRVRPESKVVIKQPPSHYLPLLYFDTITHYAPTLEYLINVMSADNVVMGTDYPYDMSDTDPVNTVLSLKNVSAADKEKILGGNAARIFKL
ncbi:MAG: amidohydrolase family protein [Chloroflexota bacterium]